MKTNWCLINGICRCLTHVNKVRIWKDAVCAGEMQNKIYALVQTCSSSLGLGPSLTI